MLSQIHDDNEKSLYIDKCKEIDQILIKQANLPKEARVNKSIILKLERLYQYLENEIIKYDKMRETEQL